MKSQLFNAFCQLLTAKSKIFSALCQVLFVWYSWQYALSNWLFVVNSWQSALNSWQSAINSWRKKEVSAIFLKQNIFVSNLIPNNFYFLLFFFCNPTTKPIFFQPNNQPKTNKKTKTYPNIWFLKTLIFLFRTQKYHAVNN